MIFPFFKKIARSHISITSCILWEEKRIEIPLLSLCSSKKEQISLAMSGSSEAVGSSNRAILGLVKKALTKAKRVVCPAEERSRGDTFYPRCQTAPKAAS